MSTGRFRSNGVVRKCSSIAWKPASSSREALRPDGEHRREADRRVHRVAAADPVPEAEHVGGVDPELRRPPRRSSRRRRSASRSRLVAERGERPLARGLRVRHRLERRERLRGDDEERLVGGQVARRLGEVGRVDVRDEAEGQVAPRVVPQRLVRHHRPEVGAADADVDDVADRLARMALPLPERTRSANAAIRSRTSWTSATTSTPSTTSDVARRHAQRDVEDRAVLGDVDPLAAEHRARCCSAGRTPRRAGRAAERSRPSPGSSSSRGRGRHPRRRAARHASGSSANRSRRCRSRISA